MHGKREGRVSMQLRIGRPGTLGAGSAIGVCCAWCRDLVGAFVGLALMFMYMVTEMLGSLGIFMQTICARHRPA